MKSLNGTTFIPNSNIVQTRNFLESWWGKFFRHEIIIILICSQHTKMLVEMISNILRYLLFLVYWAGWKKTRYIYIYTFLKKSVEKKSSGHKTKSC